MLERWASVPTQGMLVALAVFLFLVLRYRRAPLGSLSNQLLLAFSGVAAISMAMIVGAFIWQTRVILTNQAGEAFLAVARSESQRLGEQVTGETTLLQNLAGDQTFFHHIVNTSDARLGTLSPEERAVRLQAINDAWVNQTDQALRNAVLDNLASIELNNFAHDFPGHTQLILTDAYGRLVAAGGHTPEHYYYGEETWWREAWNEGYGGIYVGSPSLTPGQQTTTIEFAVPVYRPPDEGEDIRPAEKVVVGVLNSQFAIHNLRVFASASSTGETGALSLVDNTGLVLYSLNPALVGTQLVGDFQADIADNPFNWSVDPDETGRDIIHSHAILIAPPEQAYLGTLGWAIVMQQAEAEALATVGHLSQIALLGGLLVLIFAIAIGSWIARQLTHPIQELTKTASDMAGGQLERSARISGPTELRTLAEAFNNMTAQLRELISGLEQRVAERTRDLERHSAYLEASAEVGRAASSVLDADQLIRQVVQLIRERFGLYYAGLFLVDEASEWAVLRAGTGEAGQAMLARGHRIKVGSGVIGWSIAHAQARVALEAGEDAVRLATAELPDTRSEAALPLRSRGEVLGALTVQSDQPNAFDEDTIVVLQTMADQVAVALDNARLFAESQAALEATRRTHHELSHEAWANLLRAQPDLGYRSSEDGVTSAGDIWRPEMEQALQEGETIQGNGAAVGAKLSLAVPIKVRGEVVGVLDTYKPAGADEWTPEEITLLETLADQLGTALESARLYEDAQRRAARERLTREITDKMRRATNVEGIVQTVVDELFSLLGTSHAFVRLGTAPPAQDTETRGQGDKGTRGQGNRGTK